MADAIPLQAMKIADHSWFPVLTALATGGVFILATWKLWFLVAVSGALALALLCTWLWTGAGHIPMRRMRDVGLGLHLPIYVLGSKATDWWAVMVSMLGISTAFASLVFGYMFCWTFHPVWPPEGGLALLADGAGLWPLLAALAVTGA